jgi:hypothetical protein
MNRLPKGGVVMLWSAGDGNTNVGWLCCCHKRGKPMQSYEDFGGCTISTKVKYCSTSCEEAHPCVGCNDRQKTQYPNIQSPDNFEPGASRHNYCSRYTTSPCRREKESNQANSDIDDSTMSENQKIMNRHYYGHKQYFYLQ